MREESARRDMGPCEYKFARAMLHKYPCNNDGFHIYRWMSLRTLLYGSPVLCGAVAWLVLVTVTIFVRREVK
jgi:hypothetical protein